MKLKKKKVLLTREIWFKFNEGTGIVLHLQHILYRVEIWKLRQVDQKYLESLDVVLEKDAEDHLGRSCEKWRSITKR